MQGLRPPPPITSSRSPSLLFKSSPSPLPLPLPRAPSHILFFIVVVFFTMMVHSRHTTSTNGTMFRPPWLLHFARSAKFYWRRRTPGNGQRFQFLIFLFFHCFFPINIKRSTWGIKKTKRKENCSPSSGWRQKDRDLIWFEQKETKNNQKQTTHNRNKNKN